MAAQPQAADAWAKEQFRLKYNTKNIFLCCTYGATRGQHYCYCWIHLLLFCPPVGYSTCHWCHVMERESFQDEDVGKILNQHFVCIKLDREERPDVDKVYMTFVQVCGQP